MLKMAFTPNGDENGLIDLYDYVNTTKELASGCFNMTNKVDGDAVVSDRIHMSFTGSINNVTKDITSASKFMELQWYVAHGEKQNSGTVIK